MSGIVNIAFLALFSISTLSKVTRAEEKCGFQAKVVFMQDVSYSYTNDLAAVREVLPNFVDLLEQDYPGSAIGIASFSDYPFPDVGFMGYNPKDYCFRWDLDPTTDKAALEASADSLRLISGRDWPEASATAVHHLLVGDYFDRGVEVGSGGGPTGNLVVMSTDAMPHWAGDLEWARTQQPQYWENNPELFGDVDEMPVYSVVANNGDENLMCGQDGGLEFEDYVSLEQFAAALKRDKTYLSVLSASDSLPYWNDIKDKLLEDYNVRIAVIELKPGAENLLLALVDIISRVNATACTEAIGPVFTLPPPIVTTEVSPQLPLFGLCSDRPILDFMHLQDVTASYVNDLPNIRSLLPQIIDDLDDKFTFPRYGLAAFGDKPYAPFGHASSGDFCYSLRRQLNSETEPFIEAINTLQTQSGMDWKECQLSAISIAASDAKTGWRYEGDLLGNEDSRAILRVLAIATDAGYHQEGDGVVAGLEPYSEFDSEVTTYGMVDTMDYPNVENVINLLARNEIMPLFLVTSDVKAYYQRLVDRMRASGLTVALQTIADDSSDIVQAISNGLDEICTNLPTNIVASGLSLKDLGPVADINI